MLHLLHVFLDLVFCKESIAGALNQIVPLIRERIHTDLLENRLDFEHVLVADTVF